MNGDIKALIPQFVFIATALREIDVLIEKENIDTNYEKINAVIKDKLTNLDKKLDKGKLYEELTNFFEEFKEEISSEIYSYTTKINNPGFGKSFLLPIAENQKKGLVYSPVFERMHNQRYPEVLLFFAVTHIENTDIRVLLHEDLIGRKPYIIKIFGSKSEISVKKTLKEKVFPLLNEYFAELFRPIRKKALEIITLSRNEIPQPVLRKMESVIFLPFGNKYKQTLLVNNLGFFVELGQTVEEGNFFKKGINRFLDYLLVKYRNKQNTAPFFNRYLQYKLLALPNYDENVLDSEDYFWDLIAKEEKIKNIYILLNKMEKIRQLGNKITKLLVYFYKNHEEESLKQKNKIRKSFKNMLEKAEKEIINELAKILKKNEIYYLSNGYFTYLTGELKKAFVNNFIRNLKIDGQNVYDPVFMDKYLFDYLNDFLKRNCNVSYGH